MTIKTNCVVQVPCIDPGKKNALSRNEKLTGMGSLYQPYDHPDLLASLRAIARYHEWVEGRLMPIVAKWMDEHSDEFKNALSPDEQNDLGASVEAAYQVVAKSAFWQNVEASGKSFDFKKAADDQAINPIWRAQTDQMFTSEPESLPEGVWPSHTE
jgi:hypothetical protein